MKLRKIYNVGTQSTSAIPLDKFDLEHLQVVAPAETPFNVVKTTAKTNPLIILYGIVEGNNNKILSCVLGEFHSVHGQQYFIIGGSWTDQLWRRKGLITSLYVALVKHVGIKLISDRSQSPEMFAVWKKLLQNNIAKVIDVKTGEMVSISDDILFQAGNKDRDDYRFVAEHQQGVIPNVGVGVLHEHQLFTHPDNDGKYD